MIKLQLWRNNKRKGIVKYKDGIELLNYLTVIDTINTSIMLYTDETSVNWFNTHKKYNHIRVKHPDMFEQILSDIVIIINPHLLFKVTLENIIANHNENIIIFSKETDDIPEVISKFYNVIENNKTYNVKPNLYKHLIINFKGEDKEKYDKVTNTMNEIMDTFDDFDSIMFSARGNDVQSPAEFRQQYAESKGWSKDMDVSLPMFKDIFDLYNPDAIYERAKLYMELLHIRQDLLSNNSSIVDTIKTIHENNPKAKIIVISKNGKVNDKLVTAIENTNDSEDTIAASLHVDMAKQPLFDTDTNDYVRYKSGNNVGKIKEFGYVSLSKEFSTMFNSGIIKILAITGAISKDIMINKSDILIITSLKTLSYIELKNRLKLFNTDNVLYLVMNDKKIINEFNNINIKSRLNSKETTINNFLIKKV